VLKSVKEVAAILPTTEVDQAVILPLATALLQSLLQIGFTLETLRFCDLQIIVSIPSARTTHPMVVQIGIRNGGG
jgi:hypothetical protein